MIKRRIDKVEENSKNTWCKYKTCKYKKSWKVIGKPKTKQKYLKYLKIQNAWKEKHFATFGTRKYVFPNIIWPRFMLLTFFISRNALNDEIKQEFVSPSGLEIIRRYCICVCRSTFQIKYTKNNILCLFVSVTKQKPEIWLLNVNWFLILIFCLSQTHEKYYFCILMGCIFWRYFKDQKKVVWQHNIQSCVLGDSDALLRYDFMKNL